MFHLYLKLNTGTPQGLYIEPSFFYDYLFHCVHVVINGKLDSNEKVIIKGAEPIK